MTIIETAELTGMQLDWAVAKAADWKPTIIQDYTGEDHWACQDPVDHGYCRIGEGGVSPSTSWCYGGPIVERDGVSIVREWHADIWMASTEVEIGPCDRFINPCYGPTPLVAAMRCFVAVKLGDCVDVPEELA